MTPDQEIHLTRIKRMVDQKYRDGAKAHENSDPLMAMPPLEMADNVVDEAIDKVVYSISLRDKVSEMAEVIKLLNGLIVKQQAIMVMYLRPDGISETEVLSGLIQLLDGPEQRFAQEKAKPFL